MQYTEQEKAELKASFSSKRRNQTILVLPMILPFLVLFLRNGKEDVFWLPRDVVDWVVLGIVLVGLVFMYRNWRCPACSKYLGLGTNPKFCSKCGVELT